MKKVICLIESLGSGGAERQLTYLASQIKERGHNVEVWTYYPNDFYAPILEENGVTWKYVADAQPPHKRIWVLKKELKKANPDVVIAYLDTCTTVLSIIKLLGAKFKLIVSERNTTQKLSIRERLKFFFYRWADAIVPNSYTQTEFIRKRYPNLSSKLHTITNFIDTDKFCPPKVKIKRDKVRILTVARIVPQKNVLRLLEVVKRLKEDGYQFRYDWFGTETDKTYYQNCLNLIKEYNISDVFEFHKPSKNIVKEYQTSDVFCLPSLYEGFPNVICEAMSCGLPILCSNVCDNPMIVEEGVNGFLFDPNESEDIYFTSSEFLNLNEESVECMGKNSRIYILNRNAKRVFGDSYEKLVGSVV
jgi:glycosyltransferase involved in cell wall biosynthesis